MADLEGTTPVTIVWKDYCNALRAGIWSLFKDQLLVDVSLTCHQQGLKVHRLILAVFFSGFKESLVKNKTLEEETNSNEGRVSHQTPNIDLVQDWNLSTTVTEKEDKILNYLVEFAYSGKVTLPKESLENVLAAAEQLGFEGLAQSIRKHKVSVQETSCADENKAGVTAAVCETENESKELVSSSNDQFQLTIPKIRSSRKGTLGSKPTRRFQSKATSESTLTTDKEEIRNDEKETVSNESVKLRGKKRETRKGRKRNVCYVESSDDDESKGKKRDENYKAVEDEENKDEDDEGKKKKVTKPKAKTNRSKSAAARKKPAQKRVRARLACDRCDYTTSDKPSYFNHLAKHDPSVEVEIFTCPHCSKEFRSKNGYMCHEKTHGNRELLFNCEHCSFSTPQKWSYFQHLAVLHGLDESGNPLKETITCTQCDFTCAAVYQLKSHMLRKHTSDKPFKCEECDHSAKTRGDLNNHVKVRHCKERYYMCDTCGFRCQTQSLLNRHSITHSGVKPYKCELCGMEYATRQKYKYHVERHTSDEKPFTCHICGHASRRKDNLQMHLKRVHPHEGVVTIVTGITLDDGILTEEEES